MPTPQPAILNRNMGPHQWYVHLSRVEGSDLSQIKRIISQYREDCKERAINTVIGFGPTLLKDLTTDVPDDFQPFQTVASADGSGREAKGTQEEMLVWLHSMDKGDLWKTQWDLRQAMKGHMKVARETMTFIFGNSLDLSGFIDGTGNPLPAQDLEVAIVPEGEPGAGGSHILAQRWVHDLEAFEKLPIAAQEAVFGRKKPDSARLDNPPPESHLAHVELREGQTADQSKPKRDEISRRSTPYAFHDGTVGLYFLAFCKTQAPFRERLRAMYGLDGQPRDKLTDYSNPASGSFYFAPAVETLDTMLQ
ncbi:MAG: porphyrinogen peroxidase [Chloroflexota bacterium]|nr:porphyrinogen peroxidase [Chloroflexota bacterium]